MNVRLGDRASRPATITLETDAPEAAQILLDNKILALPVVEGKALVGIVTTKDLLQHYVNAD